MHVQYCFKKKYLPVIGRVCSDPPPCISVSGYDTGQLLLLSIRPFVPRKQRNINLQI